MTRPVARRRGWPMRAVMMGALAALAGFDGAAARGLKSPFAASPTLPAPSGPVRPCGVPPDPVRDIVIETSFKGGDYTKVDPERVRNRKAATAPLHAYLDAVVRLSDEAMRATGTPRRERQACAERWLTAWAEGDALLGTVSWPEGAYERKWTLVALSLAYLKMYGAELPPKPPPAVERWLRRLAEGVVNEYSGLSWKRNNHFYWAGLAAVAAGTVIDDRGIYAWGLGQYDQAMGQIRPDGSLPLELARGPLALYYHSYSASPLSMTLAFRVANGAGGDDAPLRRLVHLVLRGLSDPSVLADLAGGARQTWWAGGAPDGRTLAWLEAYRFATGDRAADGWIASLRPLGIVWLGGDLTHALGVSLPAVEPLKSPLGGP
ncbi:alginate lyase family protein [Methylobacterium gossipiicola]|uniref:Poly(Beta-D-mannuronate) lyase n=1 Tax=Methylobacterium gossipiicola TaxID=582675 RepID=A0A1I2S0N0_9HYPH|nr:alginate lyase family protein [Methylobacterium gossipiicola]SFG45339.1 poly(beta-D-mannuronate) lyase [Methylobacterium gossipiicola]